MPHASADDIIKHVLWTGGWDSTFRILYLVEHGHKIQPHYVCDRRRKSTDHEISAMGLIRADIEKKQKLKGSQLLPSKIVEKSEISRYEEIEKAYLDLISECYIGEQYKWLAEYCRQRGISSIDLSVHSNPFIKKIRQKTEYPYHDIFRYFGFPVINDSKKSMRDWAAEHNWLETLEKSWFCHKPIKHGKACGTCNPCIAVMEEGMGYRLSISAKVRYYVRIEPRFRNLLKHFSGFYAFLYRLKHHS